MESSLSIVEKRIIQNQLRRKPYEDIAELLDKPVSLVMNYAKEYSTGKNIVPLTEQLAKKKRAKQLENVNRELQDKSQRQLERKLARTRSKDVGSALKRQREERAVLPTKAIDYSQMRAVKIDNKTTIYVRKGDDVDVAIIRYRRSLVTSKPLTPAGRQPTNKKKKECRGCHKKKPISDFDTDVSKKDGHRDYCETCVSKHGGSYIKD
jgi:hypothetical protein